MQYKYKKLKMQILYNTIKPLNDYFERVGVDKALHFFVGALITAQCEMFSPKLVLLSFLIVLVLSIIKELIDREFDILDILWGLLGSACEIVFYFVKLYALQINI